MGRRLSAAVTLVLGLTTGAAAQVWSGASLQGAPMLQLTAGWRLELVGVGFRLPQDVALDPPDGLWLLTQVDPTGSGASALVRIPLSGLLPVEAKTLRPVSIPFSPDPARFRMGSLARHPTTGDLYVAERLGRHIYRVPPGGSPVLYARGLNQAAFWALAFDGEGRLVVLDFAGRSVVADMARAGEREWFGEGERYEGPVLYRLAVDDPLPLPRNLEYAKPVFPAAALRRTGAMLPRYRSVRPLPGGDLLLVGPAGELHRLRHDGAIASLGSVSGAHMVALGPEGELYALDHFGGRIVRVDPDGTARPFVEGLTRPMALVTLPDGSLVVAEDSGQVLRLRPESR